uniref:Annexin n=1 Tax=Lygus hesperus TaxID=30085 RepID=A0A146L6U7_LYGHE
MSYPGYPSYPPQGPGQPTTQPSAPMYQTAPLAYPIYPGSAAPQPHPYPYPPQQSSPYPSGNPSPYPGTSPYPPSTTSTPYPGSSQSSPYPSGNPGPYPGAVPVYPSSGSYQGANTVTSSMYAGPTPSQAPYTGGQSAPYPGQPAPYPSSQPAPYPSSQPASYPSSQPASSPYPSSGQQSSYPQQGYQPQQSPYPGAQSSHYAPTHQSPGAGKYPQGGQHQYAPTQTQYTQYGNKPPQPTLRPANPFNPREDAEILRRAMKGFGTDEKSIIQVLCNRTNNQRQQIAVEFKTLYGKDLIEDLKSETSGNFERALVALMMPLPEFLAKQCHKAVEGIGTVEETLVEILCTASNYEIKCINAAYQNMYGTSLESDLASDTSGNFKRLLVSVCQANRSEILHVDQQAAVNDAQQLLRAGELRLGTDESTFNAILCSRSYPQLNAVFMEYQRLTGNDFETAIRNEFSGDVQNGLLAIVKSTTNKSRFFAEEIHNAMKGAGTEDESLIRLIVSRCETDLGSIKEAYALLYGRTIQEDVASETSGDYKRTLLALLVGNVN